MKTIKQFAAHSRINEKLIRAVVKQSGGWEEFADSAQNITNHGASGGFSGFIYYTETGAFYAKNRALIIAMAQETANDFGENLQGMIEKFNGLKDSTPKEIGQTLWGEKSKHDTQVSNTLAWYALEEVARSYVDFLED